ncbi:MAG: methionine adenosyltransferase [Trueperaceae bacterium]
MVRARPPASRPAPARLDDRVGPALPARFLERASRGVPLPLVGGHALVQPRPRYAPHDEVVERKGVGHPDSLCDHLAEALAAAIVRDARERFGRPVHFNVDKALLAAGAVEVGFGGGALVRPTRIVLAGKVDRRAFPLPLEALIEAAYARLFELLPWASREAYRIEVWLEASSRDLAPLLDRGVAANGVPLANDTSVATAFAARSPLEAAVHAVERALADPDARAVLPIGADVKVLGTRYADAHLFDVAVPVLAERVPDAAAYRGVLDAVRAHVVEAVRGPLAPLGGRVFVHLNGADLDEASAEGAYLTLTGSSAEAGDDGQVGRGNRIGGLITPCRLGSMEAACGKNPWAHVGKLYQAIAWDAAHAIVAEGLGEGASVTLTSRIGQRVDRPVRTTVEVHGDGLDPGLDGRLAELVAAAIGDWRGVAARLEDGAYELA